MIQYIRGSVCLCDREEKESINFNVPSIQAGRDELPKAPEGIPELLNITA